MIQKERGEKKSADLPANRQHGRPITYWQKMIVRTAPIVKKLPGDEIRPERMPEKDLQNVCTAIEKIADAEGIKVDWWAENLHMLHPHDAARIATALLSRRNAGQEELNGYIIKWLKQVEDPRESCAMVTKLLKMPVFSIDACSVLERDIHKYEPESAAIAVEAGLSNSGIELRVAYLISSLPVKQQERPIKKALASGNEQVASIGIGLLEHQSDKSISDIIRYVLKDGFVLVSGVRLAKRIVKLPPRLRNAPMIEAIRNGEMEVTKIGLAILTGETKGVKGMEGMSLKAKSKRLMRKAVEHVLETGGKPAAAVEVLGLLPDFTKKTKMELIKKSIMNRWEVTALEGVRLLRLESKEEIGKAVEELLQSKVLGEKAMAAVLELLDNVDEEKKRWWAITLGLEKGGAAGKAAFSQLALVEPKLRFRLWNKGMECLKLDEIDLEAAFLTLTPKQQSRVLLDEFAGPDDEEKAKASDKRLRAFAPLVKELDFEGLKRVVPVALRSKHGFVFRHAYDAMAACEKGRNGELCDYTADELLPSFEGDWCDAPWLWQSLLDVKKELNDEDREIQKAIHTTVDRQKAVLLAPYLKEKERKRLGAPACDALEEFIRQPDFDFTSLGEIFVRLIAFQPPKRQAGLYGLAAARIARKFEPQKTPEGKTITRTLEMNLFGAIPALPEEYRPPLYEKAEEILWEQVREGMWFKGERVARALSFLPRKTQIEFSGYVYSQGRDHESMKKLMDDLMPGVLEKSLSDVGFYGRIRNRVD
ncbi:MAG: hypothetical protein NTX79_07025 [Candidatus Micrarchaeota archaeon]|nr:hypothetical protein [Candidatus Micrarchaeota archaeon]